jgi:hypothetical protein
MIRSAYNKHTDKGRHTDIHIYNNKNNIYSDITTIRKKMRRIM